MNAGAQLPSNVVRLPLRAARSGASSAVGVARAWSSNAVDDWGRDAGLVGRAARLGRLRWNVDVVGADHVPRGRGALIVVNARRFALAPVFAAIALGSELHRPVRFVGRPDLAPIGPLLQRLGALLSLDSEIEGALRAGEVVVAGATPTASNTSSGTVDRRLVRAAVAAGAAVLPAATTSTCASRAARLEIGTTLRASRRKGPLGEEELASTAERSIDALLASLTEVC